MLWERAKNLMILFLFLLNIMLAWFLYVERSRYTLSAEQEHAIYSVFNQNRISMYSNLIRQYPPMRTISVSGYHYDTEALLDLFFDNPSEAVYMDEPNKEVYEDEIAKLVISNGYISYDNPYGFGNMKGTSDKDAAVVLCDTFIKRYYPNYRLDSILPVEEGLRLCYREVYQKYIIYTNFIEFLVTLNGIEQIDMQYGEVLGFNGAAKDICAPDEALLTFVQRIRHSNDNPVLITDMDLVYYQEEFSVQENIPLQAIPYYRIFIQYQDIPFMINAYTNTMLY